MARWWVALAVALAACGGEEATDEGHEDLGAHCTELMEACEEAMSDEGMACHEVAHGGDEAECEAELDACLETCAS